MLAVRERTERSPIWGDGFAEDSWVSLSAVRSMSDLSVDEYARLFPQIVARGSEVPTALLDYLTSVVALAGNCLQHGDEVATSTMPRTTEGPAADLRFLQDVLLHFDKTHAPPPFGDDERARFAFLSRIHPGYIWPESIITAERDAAAAWLGILGSGRAAFMTIEVADYFADIIDNGVDGDAGRHVGGSPRLRDPYIASLASRIVDSSCLLNAAWKRQRGVACVVGGRAAVSWYEQMKTSAAARAVTRCARLITPSKGAPASARAPEGHPGRS